MLSRISLLLISISLVITAPGLSHAQSTPAKHGMVATVDELATKAGVNAMKQGGNAVDAAVAAGLTLGVVDGYNSGIGGGCFLLVRKTNGAFLAIDGREMAPAASRRDMFIRNGKADTQLSQLGALASGVPGALAAYDLALRKCGKLTLKTHLLNAAKIAEEGFRVDKGYAAMLRNNCDELSKFEGTRAALLKPDGKPYFEGDILKQPDLARTYRAIATNGPGWFYGGPFAAATADWMKKNGGIMTAKDFQSYQAIFREPIFTYYRGYTVACFPPPSSGGVHVIEILNMLETRDLKSLGSNSVDKIHFIAEAMKLAFADRAFWLGDPDFVKVPKGLITKKYARTLASQIKMDQVTKVAAHGTPEGAGEDVFKKHTTHFSAADAEGTWVACTATVNTSFGSKVVIPGTGVVMNNEMDDFSIEPGVANFFGLVGAEANAVAPGKRPLSSMSPTIVIKQGEPIMSLGAAGGPTIISQTLLNIVNFLDFGIDINTVIAMPRFHQQWSPDELRVEQSMDPALMAALEKRGHKLKKLDSMGVSQAVVKSPDGKSFIGAADPRAVGKAEGW
jgi:gamma-glutamyltranspeptidase/glutathione hydrolase